MNICEIIILPHTIKSSVYDIKLNKLMKLSIGFDLSIDKLEYKHKDKYPYDEFHLFSLNESIKKENKLKVGKIRQNFDNSVVIELYGDNNLNLIITSGYYQQIEYK